MFAMLSRAFEGSRQGRQRRAKSTPVVTELEGRALLNGHVGLPFQVPGQVFVIGGSQVVLNSFQPGGHTLSNGSINNVPVTLNGFVPGGSHVGQIYGSTGTGGHYGGTGGIHM